MDSEFVLLTRYIKVWFNQLISIIYLVGSLIVFSLPQTIVTTVISIALFLLFIVSQFMTLKMRGKFFNDLDEYEKEYDDE